MLLILVWLFIGVEPVHGQQKVHRVLFVGNSYTYYHSMPQLFAAISEHSLRGDVVETKFLGGGGATLKQHWDVGLVVEELKTSKWDYVVLQGQSMLGSDDLTDPKSPTQFYAYAELLDREIAGSGAETIFFLTWSRETLKDQQKYLNHAYTHIAKELGRKVSPVGFVWHALRDHPSLQLYEEDGSHPAIAGSYLAAMTLSATIFGAEFEDVPGALYGYEILRGGVLAEEKTQLSNLSEKEVLFIQEAVAKVSEMEDINSGVGAQNK